MKVSLRKLDALLHKIQMDHNNYRSDPYWKGELVSNSDPEYAGLFNEDAMRKREVDFHAVSKDARNQLHVMEQLTQVSPDCRHLHGRCLASNATLMDRPAFVEMDSASDCLAAGL